MEFLINILLPSKISLTLNRVIKKIFLPHINSIAALSCPAQPTRTEPECVSQKSYPNGCRTVFFIEKCEFLPRLLVNLNCFQGIILFTKIS